jgi:hypothetical protein
MMRRAALVLALMAAITPAGAQSLSGPGLPTDLVYYDQNSAAFANTFGIPLRGKITTVSPAAGVITLNFSTAQYFIINLDSTCPCTLANPSGSIVVPQSALLYFVQDGTGGRTVTATGTDWIAAGGAAGGFSLSSAAGAVDIYSYTVYTITKIGIVAGIVNGTH